MRFQYRPRRGLVRWSESAIVDRTVLADNDGMKLRDLTIGSFGNDRMDETVNRLQERLCLEKGEVFHVDPITAWRRIECQRGRVWITQTGLGQDVILSAGDAFEVSAPGRLVVEALEAACVAPTAGKVN